MAFGRQNSLRTGFARPVKQFSIGTGIGELLDRVQQSKQNEQRDKSIDILSKNAETNRLAQENRAQQFKDLAQARLDEDRLNREKALGKFTSIIEKTPEFVADPVTGELVEDVDATPSSFGSNLLEGLNDKQQSEFVGRVEGTAGTMADRANRFKRQQEAKLGRRPAASEKTVTVFNPNDPNQELNIPVSQLPQAQQRGLVTKRPSAEKDTFVQREKEAEAKGQAIERIKFTLDTGTIFSDEFTSEQSVELNNALSGITKNLNKSDLEKLSTLSEEQLFDEVNKYLLETKGGRFVRDPLGSVLPFGNKGFNFELVPEAVAKLKKNR